MGWPSRLWIVRHGESAGNVARDAALAGGLDRIAVAGRDVDVPLSEAGGQQARALAQWIAHMTRDEQPQIVLSSPYRRARSTAAPIAAAAGQDPSAVAIDERLREKEFGMLDGLTAAGIRSAYPEQAQRRDVLGKFYYRPPGGESWCDVILRLRSALDTIGLHYAGKRVLIVSHQVVVLCLRYILENMDEEQILAIDREGDIANCGVTEYRLEDNLKTGAKVLALERYNFVAPLESGGAPVTAEPAKAARA